MPVTPGSIDREEALSPPRPPTSDAGTPPGLRLGVFAIGSDDWIAGGRHLVNLLAAIRAAGPPVVETFLVNPGSGLLSDLDDLGITPTGIIRYHLPQRRTPRSVFDSMVRRVLAIDPTADRELAAVGVGLVFGNTLAYRLRRVRTVSWIPDLQHIHLPDHFSEGERERRSAAFRRCLAVSDRVVITSATVRDDLARLAPAHAAKCVVLQPASAFPAAAYEADPQEVVAAYRLPERFFYLPNHFWTHKNHMLVLEAVRILRDRGERVVIVMTGMAADFRSPLYASDVFRRVAELGLRDQLLYLGVVPRRHVELAHATVPRRPQPISVRGMGLLGERGHGPGQARDRLGHPRPSRTGPTRRNLRAPVGRGGARERPAGSLACPSARSGSAASRAGARGDGAAARPVRPECARAAEEPGRPRPAHPAAHPRDRVIHGWFRSSRRIAAAKMRSIRGRGWRGARAEARGCAAILAFAVREDAGHRAVAVEFLQAPAARRPERLEPL